MNTDEQTTTTLTCIGRYSGREETGYDTVILIVPDTLVTPPPGSPGGKPELALFLEDVAISEAKHMGEGLRRSDWWITRDPAVVEQRSSGDRCPTCRAGTDQALARLKEHPETVLAVGRLSWFSV